MARHSFPPVQVRDIVAVLGPTAGVVGDDSSIVTGITQDSGAVRAGDLFCCVRGRTHDGHRFAHDAIAAGATALLVDSEIGMVPRTVTVIHVENVRPVLGAVASLVFGNPAGSLRMIGVTGTNGKTSTVEMIGAILRADGRNVKVMGTLTGIRTTPEAIDLHALLAEAVRDGVRDVVMEVSSHALDQDRAKGITFAAGVITNVTRDHLDYHGTEEAYFAAKAKLFEPGISERGVVNRDDPRCRLLQDVGAIPMVSFGEDDAVDKVVTVDEVRFTWRGNRVVVPMGGNFTVLNALAAITTAHDVLGVDADVIVRGCQTVRGVSGRFESVPNDTGVSVVVDYAHTPDGLQSVLDSARSLTAGRVIVVFGCGGERDQGKRPLMGAVAAEHADEVWVTSDNPRGEDPESIIDEIIAGLSGVEHVHRQADRAEAIASAISGARRGDIVVIAGKGHEQTQEIRGVHTPFSDVDVARSALDAREGDAT